MTSSTSSCPGVGANVMAHASCAEIESTKSVSEIFSPVTGTIVEVNSALDDAPEQVNADPYGAGWIFVVEMADPAEVDGLLDAAGVPRAGRGGLITPRGSPRTCAGAWSTTSTGASTPPRQMAADEALLDAVAGRRAARAAAVPLVAAGALARSLPARRRRRRATPATASVSTWCAARPGDRGSCTAPTSPTRSPCPGRRARRAGSTPSTACSPAR